MKEKGISRRNFLKYLTISATGVALAEVLEPFVYKNIVEAQRVGPPELETIPHEPLLFGIAPDRNSMNNVREVSEALGFPVDMVNLYASSSGRVSGELQEKMREIVDYGMVPMYSWYPNAPSLLLLSDADIRQGARDMKSLGGLILFRPLYEMNGTWFTWHKDYAPEETIECWRRIFDVFNEEGATNVKFVFSPNATVGAHPIELFYPGNEYVHFTALDVYDRYSGDWLNPRHFTIPDLSPEHLIGPDLVSLMTLAPEKPFLIAEIGSMDRPEWVRNAIEYVKHHMPKFVGAISFEWNKEGQGEMEIDWQMLNDSRRKEALQTVLEKYKKNDPRGPADVLMQALS